MDEEIVEKAAAALDFRRWACYTCIVTQMCNEKRSSGALVDCCGVFGRLMQPKLFKALCDPNRIGIVVALARAGRPSTVSQVAACCPVDLSVVSRHLATLREAGILKAEKRGKEVYYSLQFQPLARTFRALADAVEACCPKEPSHEREKHSGD